MRSAASARVRCNGSVRRMSTTAKLLALGVRRRTTVHQPSCAHSSVCSASWTSFRASSWATRERNEMITRSRDAALSVDGSDMGAFFESFFVRPAVFVHRKALLTIQFVSREMVTAFQTLFLVLWLFTHTICRVCAVLQPRRRASWALAATQRHATKQHLPTVLQARPTTNAQRRNSSGPHQYQRRKLSCAESIAFKAFFTACSVIVGATFCRFHAVDRRSRGSTYECRANTSERRRTHCGSSTTVVPSGRSGERRTHSS